MRKSMSYQASFLPPSLSLSLIRLSLLIPAFRIIGSAPPSPPSYPLVLSLSRPFLWGTYSFTRCNLKAKTGLTAAGWPKSFSPFALKPSSRHRRRHLLTALVVVMVV